MLKRLFGKSQPVSQTIQRPRRSTASRWAAVMPELGRRVRVVDIQRETPDAVSVRIVPCDGGALTFAAGQYLTHCFEVDGEILRRAYSLCVAPGGDSLAFTCKRVEGGRVSGFVCERLQVGDEYEVRGPSGDFQLPADEAGAPLLFVAAGSGITPCMSLLETALQRDPQRQVTLVYASRDQDQIIFRQRLDALVEQYANLQVRHVLSRPQPGWTGEQGRLDMDRLSRLAPLDHRTEVFLCGPEALMDDLQAQLPEYGVASARIHRENFRSVNHATAEHPSTPQAIVFRRSGVELQQQPGQSILEAAMAGGVALDFSCTVGGCAACKVKVVSGRVTLDEPNCLSEQEQGEGYTLACSAYALEAVELDA